MRTFVHTSSLFFVRPSFVICALFRTRLLFVRPCFHHLCLILCTPVFVGPSLLCASTTTVCSTIVIATGPCGPYKSGRRGSNSRPSAWKADALSTELLPQKHSASETSLLLLLLFQLLLSKPPAFGKIRTPTGLLVGRDGFEPPKAYASRFTVCPIWPLWYLPVCLISPFVFPFRGIDFAPLRD